jgi:hypothetical protein
LSAPDGVLVVDKPAGPTSHDVVESVRRTLAVKKAGHTGTLDPFATGLLVLLSGAATIAGAQEPEKKEEPHEPTQRVTLSEQATKNLRLIVDEVKLDVYWRKIYLPGTVVDRPGHSDHGIHEARVSPDGKSFYVADMMAGVGTSSIWQSTRFGGDGVSRQLSSDSASRVCANWES